MQKGKWNPPGKAQLRFSDEEDEHEEEEKAEEEEDEEDW